MAFNAAVPLSSDSPGLFPAQSQENFSRLQTIVGADHQFNLAAAANDGYHNLIHMTIQAPSGALASTGRSYVKTSGGRVNQFYMDETGVAYQITPTMPIRAAANWNGVAGVSIRSSYNVSGIVRNSTGVYTISFTTAMPDVNYIVQLTGMRNSDLQALGYVQGDSSYGNSVKVGSIKVQFLGGGSSPVDVFMGNLTIFSIT